MASADQIETEYLVIAAQDGDQNAFRLLYWRWAAKLRTHACRITREDEAGRDVAQRPGLS